VDSFNLDNSSILWHRLVFKRLVTNRTSIRSSEWMVVHCVTTNISDVMRAAFPVVHLGGFAKLRKATVTSCLRMENSAASGWIFTKFECFSKIFAEDSDIDKNNGYFT